MLRAMPRTLHWMTLEGARVVERRARRDFWETVGYVEDAPYLRRDAPGFWESLLGTPPKLALAPPFDAQGRDVLRVFDDTAAMLDGDDAPPQVVRRARGRVACLSPREPGDDVVLRDLWLRHARVIDAIHFALEVPGAPPVAIAFAQSPLVIGKPAEAWLSQCLEGPGIPTLPSRAGLPSEGSGPSITIREGDEIEVLGLTWDPERCDRRFDVAGRTASYREVQSRIELVLGDAPGLRMVIRAV